jgi:hypothetical protein
MIILIHCSQDATTSSVERICYPHIVSDWPRFRLRDVKTLVCDMELSTPHGPSFIQHYANDDWQRIGPDDILHATLHKRALLLVHTSFRKRLDLSQCDHLVDEISRQSTLSKGKRRALPDDDSPVRPAKIARIDADVQYQPAPQTSSAHSVDASTVRGSSSAPPVTVMPAPTAPSPATVPVSRIARAASKQWPAGEHVVSIAEGIARFNAERDRYVTRTEAVIAAFGHPIPPSTFDDNRRFYEKAPSDLRELFIGYGLTSNGEWQRFKRAHKRYERLLAAHLEGGGAPDDFHYDDFDAKPQPEHTQQVTQHVPTAPSIPSPRTLPLRTSSPACTYVPSRTPSPAPATHRPHPRHVSTPSASSSPLPAFAHLSSTRSSGALSAITGSPSPLPSRECSELVFSDTICRG